MAVSFSGQHTVRTKTWTEWKIVQNDQAFSTQYDDDGLKYTIWGYDGPEVHVCTIWKDTVPDGVLLSGHTQAQNDSDKADFETNYIPHANSSVALGGIKSKVNSTIIPLLANESFEGIGEDVSNVVSIDIVVFSDQVSASDGFVCEWSQDNIKYDYAELITVTANVGQPLSFAPRAKYFKLRYKNGLINQTFFSITTTYYKVHRSEYEQSLRTDISPEKVTKVIRSVLSAQKPSSSGGNFSNLQLSDSGMLKVAVETAVHPSAGGATIVQKNNLGPISGTSFSKTLTNNTKLGNTIVVVLIKEQPLVNATYVLSDSQSNVYNKLASTKVSTVRQMDIWSAVSFGGPLTVQAADFSASGTLAMQVYEVSGILTYGNIVDKVATAQNTGNSHTVGPATTLQNNEFCVVMYATDQGGNISPGAGWTDDFNAVGLGTVFSQIQSSAGSLSSAATSTAPITTIGVMMTFLPAGTPKPILTDPAGILLSKISDGVSSVAIKPASTPAATTDPSLVVSLNPSSPIGVQGITNGTPILVQFGVPGGGTALPKLINVNFAKSEGAIVANTYKRVATYTVPSPYIGYLIKFVSFQDEVAASRIVAETNMGSFNDSTNIFVAATQYIPPQWAPIVQAEVTTTLAAGSGNIVLTVGYTNQLNTSGRTGTVTIPKGSVVGSRWNLVLQTGDLGVTSVQSISGSPNITGVVNVLGLIQLAAHHDESTTTQVETLYAPGAITFPPGTVLGIEYSGGTVSKSRYLDMLVQLVQ